jgi:hypothetical protein
MATHEQIKQTILRVAGNPVSGVVKDLADEWARQIVELDNPPVQRSKEKRVMESSEIR